MNISLNYTVVCSITYSAFCTVCIDTSKIHQVCVLHSKTLAWCTTTTMTDGHLQYVGWEYYIYIAQLFVQVFII